jgi:hypothetical protein
MSAQDDFGLWERELDEFDVPSGHHAVLVATVVVSAGCALLLSIGQAQVAVAGLVVSGLILALWRAGI